MVMGTETPEPCGGKVKGADVALCGVMLCLDAMMSKSGLHQKVNAKVPCNGH